MTPLEDDTELGSIYRKQMYNCLCLCIHSKYCGLYLDTQQIPSAHCPESDLPYDIGKELWGSLWEEPMGSTRPEMVRKEAVLQQI